MPGDAVPRWIGVSATLQVRPRSVDRKTRALAAPPVPIHAFDLPCTMRQGPPAAKTPSPARTAGARVGGTRLHPLPPSSVTSTNSLPSAGSLSAMPWSLSQNAMASRNTPFSERFNCRDQFVPSSVWKICACPESARPALIVQTRRPFVAKMARRSREAAGGTVSIFHVLPPSEVCATRPRVPLAHATDPLTALKPRNSAFVPLCCGDHCAAATRPTAIRRTISNLISAPPERGGDDGIQTDERHSFDPDRLAVVDDDRRSER